MNPKYLLALPALLVLGCHYEDPVWALPCEERPARSVTPGTGENGFDDVSEKPVDIQYGSQGGSHIWFAVRMRGFGPVAFINYGIVDPNDPNIVYSLPSNESAELSYNPGEKASEATGLFAFLDSYDEETGSSTANPSGKTVKFWAEITDECTPEPVRGEAIGKVK